MSRLELSYSGYVCAPYLHTHESIELKDSWMKSKNIEKLYFVTGTFSSESKPYFSDATNHYLLAKFKDSSKITKNLTVHNQEKTSFVYSSRIQPDFKTVWSSFSPIFVANLQINVALVIIFSFIFNSDSISEFKFSSAVLCSLQNLHF